MEYLHPARLCRAQRSMPVARSCPHHLPAPAAGAIWLLALIDTALWSVLAPRAVHLAVSWTTRQCAARLRRYEEQS